MFLEKSRRMSSKLAENFEKRAGSEAKRSRIFALDMFSKCACSAAQAGVSHIFAVVYVPYRSRYVIRDAKYR